LGKPKEEIGNLPGFEYMSLSNLKVPYFLYSSSVSIKVVSMGMTHTMQSIIIKGGKNNCIVWNGSTVTWPTDIVMNQVTPVAQKAPVTFVCVKSQIYIDIYNTLS
jgi:hypothetical protein